MFHSSSTTPKLLVTHHAPDLDAVGAVWLFKRFDSELFAHAKVAFVNPGQTISLEAAEEYGCQLHETVHVDTGLGEFDHHQPERGHQLICASSLVYDYLIQAKPELRDDQALKSLVAFITEIDHFHEINWPEASSSRYELMLHQLIKGVSHLDFHNDESQLHFGMQCLDVSYANLTVFLRAQAIVAEEGQIFELPAGKAIAFSTSNDEVIPIAQKQGYAVVIRKDPKLGNIRIKARPDAVIDLKPVADLIKTRDTKGSWFYHPSGKMLINGSRKNKQQTPSPLSLAEVIELVKAAYPHTATQS